MRAPVLPPSAAAIVQTVAERCDEPADEKDVDLVALDDALALLARTDPQQGRIVELRYFAGLTIEETADALEISPATVKRDWTVAKAFLKREMLRR